ncbi:hypothetical protein HBH53_187870 [Parastagonospora nodorum]|nr:hypothetical protein HBH53_187870 [Parastagonospora nodorum]KAH4893274.1 hypothetical protein HBH74_199070 [Parastagonospora nodorum]KAH4945794.1 hypothetical protein HBH73_141130 [Parastagonospora nodorum]KAH4982154.1 hypothetical protein HBI76_160610 [Parastagonospora nodorum]KAH5006287.1 hypothetical protein HBI74_219090 [Parastagonospora nodorum]
MALLAVLCVRHGWFSLVLRAVAKAKCDCCTHAYITSMSLSSCGRLNRLKVTVASWLVTSTAPTSKSRGDDVIILNA